MVHLIRTGSNRSSKSYTDSSRDPEFILRQKIEKGNINDAEIAMIEKNKGDLLKRMERKALSLEHKKKHLDRMYGEGVWDGVDNEGNMFKDSDLNRVSAPEYDPKMEKEMKEIIKNNPLNA